MRKLFNENGANYKHSNKKITVGFITAILLLTAFSGCGDKSVDYGLTGESDAGSSTLDSGVLATEYGIPGECDTKLSVGDSGLEKIEIYDTDITYPNVSGMNIAYYTKNELTSERKQEIAEALFDKDEGIYVYSWDLMTKEDIQEFIDYYERLIEACNANGDTSEAMWYESDLATYEEMLSTASDDYPSADDYSEDIYIGTIDGREYELVYSETSVSMEIHENLYKYKEADKLDDVVSCGTLSESYYSGADTGELTNLCELDESEAQLLAEDFLAELEIDDMILTETNGLYWEYYDYMGETVAIELDGYSFKYTCAIDGVPVSTKSVSCVDNITENGIGVDIPTEEMKICIDSNGVVLASWTDYMQPTGETEKNVELLTFDEILEKANENVAAYYMSYPTRFNDVEFNDIELTYYLEAADEEGVFKYVPAWVLTEYEENTDYTMENEPNQMVVIDATTGEVIDLVLLSQALGTYYSEEE